MTSSIDTTGMSMQSLIDLINSHGHPHDAKLTTPLIEQGYQSSLPTLEDQQKLREMVPANCSYIKCGAISNLSQLKVCSGCNRTRYCSKKCQKLHWRAVHRSECRSNVQKRSITLKLAERSLAVPQLVEWLVELAIATLGVVGDKYASSRLAVNIQCAMLPVNPLTIIRGEVGPRTLKSINIIGVSAVPLERAPARTRAVGLSLMEALSPCPVAVLYFSTLEDSTGDGGAVSVAYPLHHHVIDFMANRPTITIKTAIIDNVIVNINKESLVNFFNDFIRMDEGNEMRLHSRHEE